MTDHLFVYGTLLPDIASDSMKSLLRRVRRAGSATVRGELFDMGNYPALTLGGESIVRGELLIVPSPAAWMRLDLYEGFQHTHPERSVFRREQCIAKRAGGEEVSCWTYVYNRELCNASRIASGCWRKHLGQLAEIVVP